MLLLSHKTVFLLVKSLNAEDSGSKRLEISYLHDNELYTATREELAILIGAARNIVKKPSKPASFYSLTFYTSKTIFRGSEGVVC